jgi:2,3-bisphosphoglycerate-independent phosphoglycerate mutase
MAQEQVKPIILAIMDGWGISSPSQKGNPITPKNAPNYFNWLKKYPSTKICASGLSVGLVKNEDGNSEAGHFNLGAGRVVKQDKIYINDSIKDGTFFKNSAFFQAIHHLKKYKTSAHVMGLLSNHNSAHSSPEHIYAVLEMLRQNGVKNVYLHLFTDGRDSGQHDALQHLKKLREFMQNGEKIATIMGRFFAMDRGKNWDRVKLAYDAIVAGKGVRETAKSGEEAIAQAYNSEETDEFISPTVIMENEKPIATIKDNDIIIFFNMRSDRAREITKTFVQKDFEKMNHGIFKRAVVPKNIRFVAMTDFGPDLPGVLTAFPGREIKNSLPQVLCASLRRQLYIAETEKFAHVTYFFNGGKAKHFCDEDWVKIPSVATDNYCKKPAMSAKKITDHILKSIDKNKYEFICVNYANPDMVAHSGDFKATEIAIKTVNKEVERLVKKVIKKNGQMIITADHGNAEELINLQTGEIDTEHSSNLVPFIIVGKEFVNKKIKFIKKGKLADVAPTILKIMQIDKPRDMTGKSLF